MASQDIFSISIQIDKTALLNVNNQASTRKQNFDNNKPAITYRFQDNSLLEWINGLNLKQAFGASIDDGFKKFQNDLSNSNVDVGGKNFGKATVDCRDDENKIKDADVDINFIYDRATFISGMNIIPSVKDAFLGELIFYEHENGVVNDFFESYSTKYTFLINDNYQIGLLCYLSKLYYTEFSKWVLSVKDTKFNDVVPYAALTKLQWYEIMCVTLGINIPNKLRWINLTPTTIKRIRMDLISKIELPGKSSPASAKVNIINGANEKRAIMILGTIDGNETNVAKFSLRAARIVLKGIDWSNETSYLD